ncbi:cobalamin biosynthesis protein P47K [Methanolobus halotolerans]|uniref:Cobalamin biosynthesis protein P47K n=2 Tax=Methanolobus halotolerans TaxID=2052935 RepID=A0A4E0Q0P0_9EURY|nr:cobalamin biosynthesis protein P47K [Methanolobus halotolerans]
MKVLVIGGFLGSGKTSTILRLGREFSNAGKKVAIIVNEIGEVGIDGDVISKYGLQTTELTSGCICCSLKVNMKTTITLLAKDYAPDILLIEPTGIAFPQLIKNEINLMNLSDVSVQPLVTLIDGSRFKQLMKEVKNFAMRQIIDAEILGINKLDLVEEIRIPIIEASVQQLNPKAKVILLSAAYEDEHWHNFVRITLGEEADELIRDVENIELKTTNPEIQVLDKDTGLPIEATMNSIEASGITSYATEYTIDNIDTDSARSVALDIMEGIKSEVMKHSPEFVGHIKLFAESGTDTIKVNLTAYDKDVTVEVFESNNTKVPRLKILSAVSNIGHDDLVDIVQDTIEGKLSVKDIDFTHKISGHAHEKDH